MNSPEMPDVPADINQQLWENNLPNLRYLEVDHSQLLIMLAGAPGSGKTTLASTIEEQFQAVRLSSDRLRTLLGQLWPVSTIDQRNSVIEPYKIFELNQLTNHPNGLIVLDYSIDRTYPQFYQWAKEHKYPKLVISLDVSADIVAQRIHRSKRRQAIADYLQHLPGWLNDHAQFQQLGLADISLDENSDFQLVTDEVAKLLNPQQP